MHKLKQYNLHPTQMLAQLPEFMKAINALIDDLGISLADYQADHIALRVNDQYVAQQLHQAWLSYGEEWSNNMINGRPIVIIGFEQPLAVDGWTIEALELPYPSDKVYPQQGWEHIEFVVPSSAKTIEELKADLLEKLPQLDWDGLGAKGIKVKASSPSGEDERLANPTFAFKRDGVCIKLHGHSLKAVLESEQA
ncbi:MULTISPECIES: VOC family protein [unclassified Photobacterium]|uniref:VOC family protein n=1 Tax=unclassified Photobacterium TaxID=2628852 RepID=UPI001EDCFE92|nr:MULTISPECIES: VOC family protein [unclassified Photobacterium]MCG3864613.1 VOC family protein [Photobacterium sp. Ph6]MCG3876110.1 VOC family protein [Photobacterium sp. Ph5]